VFTYHDNTLDPEVERELATHTQHSENLQAFTLSELSNQTAETTQGARLRPHHSSYDTGNAAGKSTNSPKYIQCYKQIGIMASAPKTRKDHHDIKAGQNSH